MSDDAKVHVTYLVYAVVVGTSKDVKENCVRADHITQNLVTTEKTTNLREGTEGHPRPGRVFNNELGSKTEPHEDGDETASKRAFEVCP